MREDHEDSARATSSRRKTPEEKKIEEDFWKYKETRDNRKGMNILKIARGSVGKSLQQSTIQFAKKRMKAKERQKDQESESSSLSDKKGPKDSGKKTQVGCVDERKARYKDRGKTTKCVALRRVKEEHDKSQRRCNDHKGDVQGKTRKEPRNKPQRVVTTKPEYDRTKERLTASEKRKLKDKYDEIKREEKKN